MYICAYFFRSRTITLAPVDEEHPPGRVKTRASLWWRIRMGCSSCSPLEMLSKPEPLRAAAGAEGGTVSCFLQRRGLRTGARGSACSPASTDRWLEYCTLCRREAPRSSEVARAQPSPPAASRDALTLRQPHLPQDVCPGSALFQGPEAWGRVRAVDHLKL